MEDGMKEIDFYSLEDLLGHTCFADNNAVRGGILYNLKTSL